MREIRIHRVTLRVHKREDFSAHEQIPFLLQSILDHFENYVFQSLLLIPAEIDRFLFKIASGEEVLLR